MSWFDDWFGSDPGTGTTAQSTPIVPTAPPWAKNFHPTMSQNEPNQVNSLARDLAGGGFGTAPQMGAWLNSFYRPAATYQYAAPVAPTAAPKAAVPKVVAPVAPTSTTSGLPYYYVTGGDDKLVKVYGYQPTGQNSR